MQTCTHVGVQGQLSIGTSLLSLLGSWGALRSSGVVARAFTTIEPTYGPQTTASFLPADSNGLDHGMLFPGVLARIARFWICTQPIHLSDLSSPHRKLFTVVPNQSGHVEVNSLHARPVLGVGLHQPVLQRLRTENLTLNEIHLPERMKGSKVES